tara:strand:+ start:357 stop:647 length:291 start_codon:yes stop_codon:yes gene_type:complete
MHITKNNFAWLDVTKQCKRTLRQKELWNTHELYAVNGDEDNLIEKIEDISKCLISEVKICIPVGRLPKKNIGSFTDTEKVLIDGFWYVKMSDINLG